MLLNNTVNIFKIISSNISSHVPFIKYLWLSKILLVAIGLKSTEKKLTTPFTPVFFILSIVKSFEIFPKLSSNFVFNFTNFCVIVNFLTKLLSLGILFSTAAKPVVVAKLVILCTLFLTSFILAVKAVVVAKLVLLGISLLSSFILALRVVLAVFYLQYFFVLALYTSFLTTFFLYNA